LLIRAVREGAMDTAGELFERHRAALSAAAYR